MHKAQAKTDKAAILMIDSGGLSHYTSYLAVGLSKYRNVILYGLSVEQYRITGASVLKRIKFYDMGKKLPKGSSLISNAIRPLMLFLPLMKGLLTTEYSIVHIQGQSYLFFLFIPFLKLKKKAIFWTMHDVDFRPSNPGLRGKMESLQVKLLCQNNILNRQVDVIIVHGKELKQKLISRGVSETKIHVLPHFDYQYLVSNPNLESTSSNGYVLLFGKIKPYKGMEIFLNAARIVNKKLGKKVRIMIAGKGDMSHFIPLFRKSDIEYIEILNRYIPDSEIPLLFTNAKCLVLPYTEASQSGIIPLAYTFSKPVIVSNVGSITEYVDNRVTGLIFEAGNTEQLANCIIELVQNNETAIEMGKNAHTKLITEMSLETCCEYLSKLYPKHENLE